jgi:hypothetical protein
MVMRPRAPNPESGFPAGRRNGRFALSVSICLRLEIIAILSGFVSCPGSVSGDQFVMPFRPAVSLLPPANPTVRLEAGRTRAAPGSER